MTRHSPITSPAPYSAEHAPAGAWPRLILLPAAFFVGAALVYTLGQDSFWPTFLGGMVTAALVAGADLGLSAAAPRIGRYMRLSQILLILLLALAVAWFYRSERLQAISAAFGLYPPPPGLVHVDIEHLTARETGRKLTVIQFIATRSVLDQLVSARHFTQDTKIALKPGKESKEQRGLWNHVFSRYGLSVEDRWKNRLPVLQPVVFQWSGTTRDTSGQQTSLLWDASSGRGCAIHGSP
jgi:hypothetical protein